MAKVTKNQKIHRVLTFLMGLRSPDANRQLQQHGLTPAELGKAYDYVRAATEPRLGAPPVVAENKALLDRLDEFENRWYPIVNFTLTHNYPEISEWVFRNLAQTEGVDLIVSLRTLFTRIHALEDGSSPFGDEGKEAFDLLVERGLTEDEVSYVDGLLQRLESFQAEPAPEFDEEAYALAVDKLWSWYLEWGGIARTVIKDRGVLRRLGFLRTRSSHDTQEFEEESELEAEVESPEATTLADREATSQSGEVPSATKGGEGTAA